MKLVVPVGLRCYEPTGAEAGSIYIAESLDPPLVSAAAASAHDALSKVREALEGTLSRTHPRMLARVGVAPVHDVTREDLAVYPTAEYLWDSGDTPEIEAHVAAQPTDILTRVLPGGHEELSLPAYAAWTVLLPEEHADGQTEGSSPRERALEDLIRTLRPNLEHVWFHRPLPSEFEVVALEVEFEPIDVESVAIDELWQVEFDSRDLESEAEDRPQTPALESVALCWSETAEDQAAARGFQSAFHREETLQELRELVDSSGPSAVVLVGPARAGKTALVRHLAWEKISASAQTRRLWFADPPRLVATEPFTGGWRQQCSDIAIELEETDGILFIGRLIEALDAGKYVGSDYNLAQFLKPLLADRRLRLIAEATPQEWNEVERRDVGFARTFTVVRVDDPPREVGRAIVRDAARRLAKRERVGIEDAAVDRAWDLGVRFATDGSVVGRTIDFIRRTLRRASADYVEGVGTTHLVAEFCRDTGLPPVLLLDDQPLDVEKVRARLGARVIGQPEGVRRVADVVGITKAGLSSPDRPLGSFLFVGPTGVGKTELARALADYLFGDEERLIRIDMSEYSHSDAYARLIGEGRDEGDLTGPVRRQPFSVVLLDEIEKAHPGVFDLLLQVLGEARLTDVNGKTTFFRNAIVIMTSNLGVDTLRPAIGFSEVKDGGVAAYEAHFRATAERFFRPEFLARIDQFTAFGPLSLDVVEQIATRDLEQVLERDGLRSQNVEFIVGDGVARWLAEAGWDRKYGARPLKRVIEQEVVWELGRRIAASEDVDETTGRRVTLSVGKSGQLKWQTELVSGRSNEATARQALLGQVDSIVSLRRRLQRYALSVVFDELEWDVEHFDTANQSAQFWDDPSASATATRAEYARRIIGPTHDVVTELAALEDLANEAYHTRSFDLSVDLSERLAELEVRVGGIVMEILRSAFSDPDQAVLFLVARGQDDSFRRRLVSWYAKRAERRGWKMTVYRGLPERELPSGAMEEQTWDANRVAWEVTTEVTGAVIALQFEGFAARPLCRTEEGLHRRVSADGNAVVEVWEMAEYDGWPWPARFEGRSGTYVARTYNFRTREVTMPAVSPVKLVADDPFSALEATLEDEAWRLTELEWE